MVNPHKEERRAQLGKGKLTWWRKYHHHVQSDFLERGQIKCQDNYYYSKFIKPSSENKAKAIQRLRESFNKWDKLGKTEEWRHIFKENMFEFCVIIGMEKTETFPTVGIWKHFMKLSRKAADAVDDGQRVAYKHYTFSILCDMEANWINKTLQIIEAELGKE